MKEYPAFIIDRARQSDASRFSDDFVVCTDHEVGFIARVYKLPKSRREEFVRAAEQLSEAERKNHYLARIIDDTIIVLEVVRMLHEPVAHINRLPPLMKKALKAYLYGEVRAVRRESAPYDEQLAALDDVLRMAESQHARLLDMNGAAATDRFISALRSARGSVELLKQMTEHGRS